MNDEKSELGQRGRAVASPALFAALRHHYGISAEEAPDLGGSYNLNLLVERGSDRLVVRVYRPWVTEARLGEIQRVRRVLAASGVPVSTPISAKDGESWISVDKRLVEVEPFVEHDAKMDSWSLLEMGLPLLGQIHSLLQRLSPGEAGRNAPASNNIDPRNVLTGTAAGTAFIRGWNASPAELRFADDAEELARLVAHEYSRGTELPRQLVHGDYWDNNVLFRDGRIVLVADFDFMGERARIDDLALILYYTNSTFSDDQTSDRRIAMLRKLVDAYDSGLDTRLSSAERATLPLALARSSLAHVSMIPHLDSEADAHGLVAAETPELVWQLAIIRDLGRWRDGFA